MIKIHENRASSSVQPFNAPSPNDPLGCDTTESSSAFLSRIWRPNGDCHQLAFRNPRSNLFCGAHVKGPVKAADIAFRKSHAGVDAYFAPAAFKSSENRKADNAAGACCLWVDVDVGPEKAKSGDGYETSEEAFDALNSFCCEAAIPTPTYIVSTGSGGFHAYWVLDRSIGLKLWLDLAHKLKAIAKQLNFLADPSRTADIASLMRMPGTLNFKYSPPRPVVLIHATNAPIKLCVMADAIAAAHDRLISTALERPCKSSGDSGTADMALLRAILRCLDPDMTYCDWFRVAAAIFNCTSGSDEGFHLFDDWSSRGQKYKGENDTRRTWGGLRLDHPSPVTIATLRMMVEAAGYSWKADVVESLASFSEVPR